MKHKSGSRRGAGSAFKTQIIAAIDLALGEGVSTLTPAKLAARAGCNRSRCFTARCKELVEEGVLRESRYWTERGGQAISYELVPTVVPFRDENADNTLIKRHDRYQERSREE